ncbi:UTRA domain-containing protein [uncultured Lactobacillus sp.]|uniref:UTRA domain-containing protein n=1 Tax=uncultured Lactobacillus sp. TaxID=153152 RepID=UPI0025F7CC3C|nr:UTRA domain-containing protein [uncultured Lactobacillus sp.]
MDDEPLVIEHTYMPVSQVPALSKKILEGSIYSYLHKKLHIKFGWVFRRFWKLSRLSGSIPGLTLNIPGQEMFTATGLISWSKPAINN